MKPITPEQVREALDRVMQWPTERQANLVHAIVLAEEQYGDDAEVGE
jgi:hypothetical protein